MFIQVKLFLLFRRLLSARCCSLFLHFLFISLSFVSVCLILEICEFGSLSDVLRGMNAGGVTRAALSLSYADRMFLALGCAKGLQALHNYSHDLCHRDIKSMNFLSECCVFVFMRCVFEQHSCPN